MDFWGRAAPTPSDSDTTATWAARGPWAAPHPRLRSSRLPADNMVVVVKNRVTPKRVALGSGNMDQNLRCPGGLILTHTRLFVSFSRCDHYLKRYAAFLKEERVSIFCLTP